MRMPVKERSGMAELQELQTRWNTLYKEILPALAKAKDPAQKKWPVHLDHCFARITLDNAIGVDQPWTAVIKAPAVKNMSVEQLQAAIQLAEKIAQGEANLVELDERSLELRGKKSKTGSKRKSSDTTGDSEARQPAKKQKSEGAISSYFLPSPSSPADKKSTTTTSHSNHDKPTESVQEQDPDMKHMLILLCQIPRGRYSTYQAMADHVTRTSHKSCARAVGSAMRNNPFAPGVPCHRVLASDGTLGGFNGSWGEDGLYAKEKKKLLEEEGVRFDSRGKVKGPPFKEFWD